MWCNHLDLTGLPHQPLAGLSAYDRCSCEGHVDSDRASGKSKSMVYTDHSRWYAGDRRSGTLSQFVSELHSDECEGVTVSQGYHYRYWLGSTCTCIACRVACTAVDAYADSCGPTVFVLVLGDGKSILQQLHTDMHALSCKNKVPGSREKREGAR